MSAEGKQEPSLVDVLNNNDKLAIEKSVLQQKLEQALLLNLKLRNHITLLENKCRLAGLLQ